MSEQHESQLWHPSYGGLKRPPTVPFPGRVTLESFYVIIAITFALTILFLKILPQLGVIVGGVLYFACAILEEDEPNMVRYVMLRSFFTLMSLRSRKRWGGTNSCSPFPRGD